MIKEKLDILCLSQLINEESKVFCLSFIEKLEKDGFSEDDYEMFITHLAMMLHRLENGEKVDSISEFVWKEITELPVYTNGALFIENLCARIPYDISKEEKQYLIMHICKLMTKEEK